MPTDINNLKLGKNDAVHDVRTLMFNWFKKVDTLISPLKVDYSHGVTDFGMMLNGPNSYQDPTLPPATLQYVRQGLGCCTIADGPGHATQVWSYNASGRMLTPADSIILGAYETWDNFDVNNPATDSGGIELEVLKQWRNNNTPGISAGFAPLDSFVAVHTIQGKDLNTFTVDIDDVRYAIYAFGGSYGGVQLPRTIESQDVWDIVGDGSSDDAQPGSLGGHAIYFIGYDVNEQLLYFISWGKVMAMTMRFFLKYVDECYALVSTYWLNTSGISPSGFALDTLRQKAALIQ